MNRMRSFNQGQKVLKRFAAAVLAMATIVSGMPAQVNASNAKTVKDMFVSETNYAETMKETVVPYIDSFKKAGYITGEKNAQLYYETYNNPAAKGSVVICHGMCESLEKYDEMIYYYLQQGYSVYGIEHRGHSRSGRLGADATQVSIDSFGYYIKDFKKFMDQIVVPQNGDKKLYLFAHSMGGGIATRFLEMYPDYFSAAILSAPMQGVNSGKVPPFFAKLLAHGMAITPYADKYVMGQKEWDPAYAFTDSNTTCEARYTRAWQTRLDNPVLQMGGGSYKWLSECYYATNLMSLRWEARKVKVPVLLFQSGKDTLVDNNSHAKFAKYAKDVKIIRYEEAKHEMYGEKDEILFDYVTNVFKFLEENK